MKSNKFKQITRCVFTLMFITREAFCSKDSTSIGLSSTTETFTTILPPSTTSSVLGTTQRCDCSLYVSRNTLSTTTDQKGPVSTRNISMTTQKTSSHISKTNEQIVTSSKSELTKIISPTTNTKVTDLNQFSFSVYNTVAGTDITKLHSTAATSSIAGTESATSHSFTLKTTITDPSSTILASTATAKATTISTPSMKPSSPTTTATSQSGTSSTISAFTANANNETTHTSSAKLHSSAKPTNNTHSMKPISPITTGRKSSTSSTGSDPITFAKVTGTMSKQNSPITTKTSKTSSHFKKTPANTSTAGTGGVISISTTAATATVTMSKKPSISTTKTTTNSTHSMKTTSPEQKTVKAGPMPSLTTPNTSASHNKHITGSLTNGGGNDVTFNGDDFIIPDECFKVCNITVLTTQTIKPNVRTTHLTSSLTETATTRKQQLTTQQHREINLAGLTIEIKLKVIATGNFTSDLHDNTSEKYAKISLAFRESLTLLYKHKLKDSFKQIVINGFYEGSIACNCSVILSAPENKKVANDTVQLFKTTDWSKVVLNNTLCGCDIDVNKTKSAQLNQFHLDDFLPKKECNFNEMAKWGSSNGKIECIYKCDVNKTYCGNNGECYTTYKGELKCRCKQTSKYVFHGERCEYNSTFVGVTSSRPATAKPHALSRLDIIAISAGTGGGLVVILVVALICVCRKLQTAGKRNRFYNYSNFDKEALHKENSRIENAPGQMRTAMGEDNDGYYHDMQMQQFEPEGKNAVRDLGQRSRSYEKDPSPYRKISSPDVGDVMIYQPTNLRKPAEQSGLSKFDEIDNDPHPFRKMENGAQSNPYSMVDTETNYKIRRPTVNSINSNRYS